jgi:endoglycosylceramidase
MTPTVFNGGGARAGTTAGVTHGAGRARLFSTAKHSWELRAFLVAVAAGLALGAVHPTPGQPERLAHHGRWLTDPLGRVVMIRGGNAIQLVGDAHLSDSSAGGRWQPETPALLAQAGFNGIRLIVLMNRVVPAPARINTAYLDAVTATVAAYKAQGIWTLIDFHQDEYGPEVGVRGMPSWMTLTDGHRRNRSLSFPQGYFQDRAVQVAFDNFWANKPVSTGVGVQEAYVAAVAEVAKRFADEPAVFGIDLMNEPATGTPCSQPDPKSADCPQLETERLAPFYSKAGKAVAAVAPRTILFVEPFMLQGALGIPIHTPMPGVPRQGLSYHNYGPFRPIREQVSTAALALATAQRAAIINTEWGFSNDAGDLAAQAQDFDSRLIPWLVWARGLFEALVNPAAGAEPSVNREALLRAYARPYPAATAGTPLSLTFDADAGILEYRWATQGPDGVDRTHLKTEIRMPSPSFPRGYRAVVTGGRIISAEDASMLVVRADRAGEVTLHATRVGPLPPLTVPKGATASGAKLSLDSLVGDLLRDPGARAVLQKYLPTLTSSDQIGLASQASLRSMQPYLPDMTDEVMKRIEAELAALPGR